MILKPENQNWLPNQHAQISLRSNIKIQFKEDRINYEIYGKSPYIRGIRLWKQLSCETQHAENNLMFDRLLTDDIIQHLKD